MIVEDQEQADKVLGVRDALPRLERIVVDDMRGLEDYRRAAARQPRGASRPRAARSTRGSPGRYEALLDAAAAGRRGAARLHLRHHRCRQGRDAQPPQPARDGGGRDRGRPDRARATRSSRSCRSPGSASSSLSVAIALHVGATVSFPEEPETVREDLREIGPHVMIAPPRFWEAMCSEYQVKIADAGFVKRRGHAGRARPSASGWPRAKAATPGPRAAPGPSARSRGLLAFRALLDQLGLSRVRCAYTGGAPLGPEMFRVLPRHRPQPQAGVRPDRDRRDLRAPPGRRRAARRPWASRRRARRCGSPRAARSSSRARACSSATTRTRTPPRGRSTTAGSAPATPASWTSEGHLVMIDRLTRRADDWRTARASRPR